MNREDRRLKHHLVVAIAAKIVILSVLWFVFFHHPREPQPASAAVMTAAHVLGEPVAQGVSP